MNIRADSYCYYSIYLPVVAQVLSLKTITYYKVIILIRTKIIILITMFNIFVYQSNTSNDISIIILNYVLYAYTDIILTIIHIQHK